MNEWDLVVAVFPNARGFGYAVFEGTVPVDWGVSDVQPRDRNRQCIRLISVLLRKYRPDVVLLRDASGIRSRRVRDLIQAIADFATASNLPCLLLSRTQVRQAFRYLERPMRYAIAQSIAKRIPFLESHLPPARKIWNSEDRRMGLFDAVALALTYLDGVSPLRSTA
jgi:hypothetical protein